MNVVCLAGRISRQVVAQRLPPGWTHRVLQVTRESLEGGSEPGAFDVLLVLSPGLESATSAKLSGGETVTVVGRLNVDIHYSQKPPIAHYSVIAQRIESLPPAP